MGCSPSAYAREDIARYREVFEALLLGEDDICRLLKSFNKIDHMKDGTIEMAELLAFRLIGITDYASFAREVWNIYPRRSILCIS